MIVMNLIVLVWVIFYEMYDYEIVRLNNILNFRRSMVMCGVMKFRLVLKFLLSCDLCRLMISLNLFIFR